MSSPDSIETPPQLANFPTEVRAAYHHYLTHRDSESVQQIVLAALRDFLPAKSPFGKNERLRDEHRLIEDLGYDSLAVAEIVFFIEDLFQVTIGNDEIRSVATVGSLRTFVGQKLADRSETA
jgi:acyl carrier protein